MTNVLGDSIGAAVIEHLSQRELELQEAELTLPSLGKPYKSLMAQEKGASRGRGGNESVMWEASSSLPREEGRDWEGSPGDNLLPNLLWAEHTYSVWILWELLR